ncbi:hypothetical protein IFM89_013225 [Coptis chinensis]|uniref:Kinesin motor domain-containing protein n=1 Tax=Coptis chinensis TaxID=261450 RepID=A0A835M614_9MAGN|nr:hypothetical protein IFM89_013225 [Coptis chinensis]
MWPFPGSAISWKNESLCSEERVPNGRSMLGFSLTSPDLVLCTGSPDIPNNGNEEFRNSNVVGSIELSLDKGIDGRDGEGGFYDALNNNVSPEASLDFSQVSLPIISINAGGSCKVVPSTGVEFIEDSFFTGGDVIRTETSIGDTEEGGVLYQTARCGNCLYKFEELVAGNYIVDLHFAEIIFINGPSGMRVFNVFIQEEKVVSAIDIYDLVGSNKPLMLSGLKAFVNGNGGLSIRFEGVTGKPVISGISVKKDHQAEYQFKELTETKRNLQWFKKEYELKSKECQETWKSLRELQNELMRKSMHVGSLGTKCPVLLYYGNFCYMFKTKIGTVSPPFSAYAIEGQVKEKSRWFLSLRDLTKKFKMLKVEHKNLLEEALEYKKGLEDMTQVTTMIECTIHQNEVLEKEHKDLKLKFIEGSKERKELYNKVLELKGNIRVFCRCRPLNSEEIAIGASMAIDFESAKDGELMVTANGASKKVYKFDSVFSPQADQADVFEDTSPFATSVLDGYNVCIFAYGQTGTGKTFTMEGPKEDRGVNYRTLEELFRTMRDRQGLYRYEVSVSVLEVYNEQIRDLLVPGSQSAITSKRLEIRQVADGVHHVPGLVEAHVSNMNEVWEVLQTGSNLRAVGATNANEHSSRSHCIHCVMVKGENLMNGECTRSKLWLVDLAGSERVAKTDVQGERLKETQNINRSLSALGDVISALATKSPHIPFRNSKLTHLLQDSLGGDSKTLMFVQISPNENDLSETLCSLNFASRVRGIELGPAKKQLDNSELVKYKQMVEKTKQDMKSKDSYIKKMEETIHGLELKAKTRDLNNKNLQEKVKELESQLLVERRLARQHVDNKIAEQQQQQQKQLQEEQNAKPPLSQLCGNPKMSNELTSITYVKDEVSLIRPLTEKNNFKPSLPPPTDSLLKYNNLMEKENKPDNFEQPPLPRRTGRLSVCPPLHRIPEAPAPRRNSLIPLPATGRLFPGPPVLPLQPHNPEPFKDVIEESESNNLEQTPYSVRGQRTGTKKFNSILRRSFQKKVQIKSPLQQHMRKAGGMEKVRNSISGRGKIAQRAMISNATKVTKEMQSQKEKEKRGWNF